MAAQLAQLPFPPHTPLAGREAGSFADGTISTRLPAILDTVLADLDRLAREQPGMPAEQVAAARAAVQQLQADMRSKAVLPPLVAPTGAPQTALLQVNVFALWVTSHALGACIGRMQWGLQWQQGAAAMCAPRQLCNAAQQRCTVESAAALQCYCTATNPCVSARQVLLMHSHQIKVAPQHSDAAAEQQRPARHIPAPLPPLHSRAEATVVGGQVQHPSFPAPTPTVQQRTALRLISCCHTLA